MWLDAPADGQARAGELCERHARTLTPPQGWRLDDRRPAAAAGPRPDPVRFAVSERRGPEADARTLLHARSPLLARAFESSGRL